MINVGQPSQIKYGYVRQGLVQGMILENELGSNPFKYGIVVGSDSHSAHNPSEEFNFHILRAGMFETFSAVGGRCQSGCFLHRS